MMTPSSVVTTAISTAATSCSNNVFRIRPCIVVFGDSITQNGYGIKESDNIGWVSLLSSAYTRRCDVLNRGYSGYNTRNAVEMLHRVFGTFPISSLNNNNNNNNNNENNHDDDNNNNKYEGQLLFCTIFFGANDAVIPGESQHVPIDEYGSNLDTIIRSIRRIVNNNNSNNNDDDNKNNNNDNNNSNCIPDNPLIILMTPPPIDEDAWSKFRNIKQSDRTNYRSRQYGNKMKEIAYKYNNCEILDTWELLDGNDPKKLSKHLYDGLHLNSSGNQLIFNGLYNNIILKKYPHLAPMNDDDGNERCGTHGIPVEEKLWTELNN